MPIVVQKYGGSSVASTERILNVARRIVATYDAGNSVCAVVSARGDTTDELLAMAHEITPRPPSASSTCCSRPASASAARCWPWRSTHWAARP